MNSFKKNVLKLMSGTIFAQIITIAISPILTRLYTPAEFGIFAVFFSIVTTLGVIVNGRYELAIVLPKRDRDAIHLVRLAFRINVFVCSLMLALILFFNSEISSILSVDISLWLYFVPISVFMIGSFSILNYYGLRNESYSDIAKSNMIKSIVQALIQVFLGAITKGAGGLVLGEIISRFSGNVRLYKIYKYRKKKVTISKRRERYYANKYKKFPIHSMFASFVDSLSIQLPIFMIAKIYGASIVGFFILAQRIVALPASVISSSFSQVYFKLLTDAKNSNQQCFPILLKSFRKLLLISLPITALLFIFIPHAIEFVFGHKWIIAGDIARYLSLIFFITFIVSPLSISLIVSGDNKLLALWQYGYLIFGIVFFLIFFILLDKSYLVFLFWYVIYQFISYSIYLVIIILCVKKLDTKVKLKT